jgi:hypothetical protein
MALLLLLLLAGIVIFLFYYELLWKKFERVKGQSLVWSAKDFLFGPNAQPALTQSPRQDWKYRTLVELHRKNQLYPKEAATLAGVSLQDMERYFDELESQGKVQSAGDAERGIFYRPISSVTSVASTLATSSRPEGEARPAGMAVPNGSMQARGFE